MSCNRDAKRCQGAGASAGTPGQVSLAGWGQARQGQGHCPRCGRFLRADGTCTWCDEHQPVSLSELIGDEDNWTAEYAWLDDRLRDAWQDMGHIGQLHAIGVLEEVQGQTDEILDLIELHGTDWSRHPLDFRWSRVQVWELTLDAERAMESTADPEIKEEITATVQERLARLSSLCKRTRRAMRDRAKQELGYMAWLVHDWLTPDTIQEDGDLARFSETNVGQRYMETRLVAGRLSVPTGRDAILAPEGPGYREHLEWEKRHLARKVREALGSDAIQEDGTVVPHFAETRIARKYAEVCRQLEAMQGEEEGEE